MLRTGLSQIDGRLHLLRLRNFAACWLRQNDAALSVFESGAVNNHESGKGIMSKPTNAKRSQCHGRPRSSDGHQPSPIDAKALTATCVHCKLRISNVLGAWLLSPGESLRPQPEKQYVLIDAAGQIANCDRCGAMMRVADRRNKDSHPFKLAEKPKGVCANCAVTHCLYNTYPINWQIDEAGPELLLTPGLREAFLSCGMLDHCDLNIDEVNWSQVVANWSLPVKHQKSPTNPYKMGDSPKSHLKPKTEETPDDPFTEKWRSIFSKHVTPNGWPSDVVLTGDQAKEFMEESGLKAALEGAEKRGDKWVN